MITMLNNVVALGIITCCWWLVQETILNKAPYYKLLAAAYFLVGFSVVFVGVAGNFLNEYIIYFMLFENYAILFLLTIICFRVHKLYARTHNS